LWGVQVAPIARTGRKVRSKCRATPIVNRKFRELCFWTLTSRRRRVAGLQLAADPQPVAALLRAVSHFNHCRARGIQAPISLARNLQYALAMSPITGPLELSVQTAVDRIASAHRHIDARRSTLVAISGIDGSGKGYLTRELDRRLRDRGLTVAVINVDGWLRLPQERFSSTRPAEHFYTSAFRFEDMFEKLVVPLRERRWVSVEADFADETASAYRKFRYQFSDIDVILLEGIYLLKREYQHHYDASLWIACSFDTALKRAVARAQEGLPPEETVRAYRQIYFPAQEIHFRRDSPREAASLILDNDSSYPRSPVESRTANV